MTRKSLLYALVGVLCAFAGGAAEAEIEWTDAAELTIEGQGWSETRSQWDRLPAKAEEMVRNPVWNLSRHPSGILVRFRSNARELHARWTLSSDRLSMPHMAATGVSGLDLYVHDGKRWRWVSTPRPDNQHMEARLINGLDPGMRDWMIYLPLYNGVRSLSIGIPEGSVIEPMPERSTRPIVFYGTSITHGACASRPGMTHVAIIGRDMDRPVINLGFSGNGTMDIEIADLMAEIDASVYVIDCLPNLDGKKVSERAEPFVKRLRELRPSTPILLVEDRTYANAHISKGRRSRNEGNRAALQAAYASLQEQGVQHLYYLEGDRLLGDDDESTVDGSHPTDLGFRQQADAFIEVLTPITRQQDD